MRYLLAVVLIVAVAEVGRADGMLRLGMTKEEVGDMPGRWVSTAYYPCARAEAYYTRTDAAGGTHHVMIGFVNGRLTDVWMVYRPFTAHPPWLEFVWLAFGPSQKNP
jgi:hypothetical protein